MTTYTHDARMTYVRFKVGEPIPFRMVAPMHMERSTGTMRYPELAVDLPAELVAMLSEEDIPTVAGQAVGVVLHLVSRRAQLVGPFDSAAEADAWWNVRFNRMASNTNMLFLVATPGLVTYSQPTLVPVGEAR